MIKILIFLISTILSLSLTAQNRMIKRALAFKMNVNPTVEYWPTKEGKFITYGSTVAISINDGFYVGGYYQTSYNSLTSTFYKETKLYLTHFGFVFGGVVHNFSPRKHSDFEGKFQIAYNVMLGSGILISEGKIRSNDFYYEAMPGLELEYKLNDAIRIGVGGYSKLIMDLNELYKNPDLGKYGLRIDMKFSFFDYKFGMIYRNRILGL